MAKHDRALDGMGLAREVPVFNDVIVFVYGDWPLCGIYMKKEVYWSMCAIAATETCWRFCTMNRTSSMKNWFKSAISDDNEMIFTQFCNFSLSFSTIMSVLALSSAIMILHFKQNPFYPSINFQYFNFSLSHFPFSSLFIALMLMKCVAAWWNASFKFTNFFPSHSWSIWQ